MPLPVADQMISIDIFGEKNDEGTMLEGVGMLRHQCSFAMYHSGIT